MIKETVNNYNSYKFYEVVQILENFLVSDLSRTYIQLTRERADETFEILNKILLEILKLFAPIIPLVTEKIWQELRDKKIVKEESVHLTNWMKVDEKKIDKKLESLMEAALQVIEKGLGERDKLRIGLKWPLKKAVITLTATLDPTNYLKEIIKDN